MKKKVLHIISSLNDGGAEGVLYKIVSKDSKNIEHVVVSLTEGEKYNRLLSDAGIQVKNLHMSGAIKTFFGFFALCSFIYREKPTVVQTWMYHSDVIGGIAAFLLGVKNIVWNIRSGEIHRTQKITTRAFIKLSAILSAYIPNTIISCSYRAIEVHKKVGYKGDFVLIDNGIDDSLYYPSDKKRQEFRGEVQISESCILIGMVARFDPQKDHMNLLRSVSEITKTNYQVLLIGSNVDSNNSTLLNLISDFGIADKVVLMGQRMDIHRVMCGLDFLVLPSLYGEAFPNVVIEAMSVGTPCIVTDIGDSARIVKDCGWIVQPGSSGELSTAIRSAIDMKNKNQSEYNFLSQSCVNRVRRKFLTKRMILKYENIWNG